ncbi:MAG: type II toxin-antitoxin system RelE/ParE family toxin [Pseudomonadota bacterium]
MTKQLRTRNESTGGLTKVSCRIHFNHAHTDNRGLSGLDQCSQRPCRPRARIQVRVDRLAHGNPGQFRNLSDGVSELKIDVGPGYRVYYTERDGELIILLAGGDKATQQQDIKTAVLLANNL